MVKIHSFIKAIGVFVGICFGRNENKDFVLPKMNAGWPVTMR